MDATTFMMPLVQRISSLGYIVRDGDKGKEEGRQAAMSVKGLPSLLSLVGYVTFPVACILGPFIEFKDYEDYTNKQGHFENPPDNTRDILITFAAAIVSITLQMTIPLWIDIETFYTPEFGELPFYYKLFLCYFGMLGCRGLYYFGWLMTDTAMHVSGITYSGTGDKFNRIYNLEWRDTEFASNPRQMIDVSSLTYRLGTIRRVCG